MSFLVSILLFFCDDKFLIKNRTIHNSIIYFAEISYSFYLWHLLIIYFYKLYFGIDIFGMVLIFLITLTLSSVTFKFIEQKFRYMKIGDRFSKKYFYIIPLILLMTTSGVIYISQETTRTNDVKDFFKNKISTFNFLEKKLNFDERTNIYNFKINNSEIYTFCTVANEKYSKIKTGLRNECLKNDNKKKLFFIMGNSHTANFIPMFNDLNNGINFYYSHSQSLVYSEYASQLNKLVSEYEEIIFTTEISSTEHLNQFFDSFKDFNKNIKILIIGPIPHLPITLEPLVCFIQQNDCFFNVNDDFKKRKIKNLNKLILEKINSTDRKIFFYKPFDFLCPKDQCYVHNKNKDFLKYRDDSHLTMEGSLSLTKNFKKFYKNNFN